MLSVSLDYPFLIALSDFSKVSNVYLHLIGLIVKLFIFILLLIKGRRCRDRMEVGFTTICAISAYHH